MADLAFNTIEGQTIARETLIAFLNTADVKENPVWSPIGVRVTKSNAEYDWQRETSQDIIGNSYSEMKKPIITQAFDPWPMTNGDAALLKLWNTGIKDQNAQALSAQDMLIVHKYANPADTQNTGHVFAERYEACAIEITGLGGDGGGNLTMPINVTYGGTRTTGKVTVADGVVTYFADSDVTAQ